jgi:hypothetical protein
LLHHSKLAALAQPILLYFLARPGPQYHEAEFFIFFILFTEETATPFSMELN